ncbi:MAG: M48 family metallopeptidase [Bacilli bacterium]|jgi:predicted metal-dependent hydrolase|nr:M48 family metallopeptidase [Bacilli bacterium]
MTNDKYFGPFETSYQSQRLLCCLTISSRRGVAVRLFYGILFFFVSSFDARRYFHSDDLDKISQDLFFMDGFNKLLEDFFNQTDALRKFQRKGVYLSGEEYLCPRHAFILGEKKLACYDLKEAGEGKIYGKDYESIKEVYKTLALAHFKKRIAFYSEQMQIPVTFKVRLSTAVNYLGVNNFKLNIIGLNQALYAYKEEVSDSVIVHELAHFFYHDHSKGFYDIVIKNCPSYYRYRNIIMSGDFQNK